MESRYRSIPVVATLLVIAATLLVLEIGVRLIVPDPATAHLRMMTQIRETLNTPAENDPKLPLYLPRQGGDCVHRKDERLRWHPRFGFHSKTLDSACARRLFSAARLRVVFFGGSTMANFDAINYLTSLDYLAFGAYEDIASVNLAEPGTRLSNGVARFIEEGIELKPDVAVFLDGNNEFLAIRYGGNPGDDVHWTIGVLNRIEAPAWAALDRAINQSRLAQVALIGTGLFPSARRVLRRNFDLGLVDKDVVYYLHARETAEALCAHYHIRCIFILQPNAMLIENPSGSTKQIVEQQLRYFPFDRDIYARGYQLIREAATTKDHIDASRLLDDVADAFTDEVHLSKTGSAALAALVRDAVLSQAVVKH
jgi:hypothetical protein